jgi:hypothetical protein
LTGAIFFAILMFLDVAPGTREPPAPGLSMPGVDAGGLDAAVRSVLDTRNPGLANYAVLAVPMDRYHFGIAVYVRWSATGPLGAQFMGEEVIVIDESDGQPKQFLTLDEYLKVKAGIDMPALPNLFRP